MEAKRQNDICIFFLQKENALNLFKDYSQTKINFLDLKRFLSKFGKQIVKNVGNISENAIHISGIPKQTISASKLPQNCHIYYTKKCM